jgi:hypothetical protein
MTNQEKAIKMYESGSLDYRRICQLYNSFSDSEMSWFHVHHIDGNHKNNNPLNLLKCTAEEHAEIHKSEGLFEFLTLQEYGAKKGLHKIHNRPKEEQSASVAKVWASYTPEQRVARIANLHAIQSTPEYRKNLSESLTGFKRPPRTEEHNLNWKKSNSIGLWCFGGIQELSATDLAKKLGLKEVAIRRLCKTLDKVIRQVTIDNNPHFFKEEHLGKTFKQIGFNFIKNQNKGDTHV